MASGGVVRVDVDALSGAVSTAVSQAIRQHTRSNVINTGNAAEPSGQPQSSTSASRIGTLLTQCDDEQPSTSSSGRKRR